MKINTDAVLAYCSLSYFIYSHWYLKKDNAHAMPDTRIETTFY